MKATVSYFGQMGDVFIVEAAVPLGGRATVREIHAAERAAIEALLAFSKERGHVLTIDQDAVVKCFSPASMRLTLGAMYTNPMEPDR